MHKVSLAALFALASLSAPAFADDVTDTLNSAIAAYEEGDIQYALEELEYAKQLLAALKTEALTAYLPEPPEGWTREIDEDMATGLAMMGGGVGTQADYSDGAHTVNLTIMADNPMVMAMGGMVANAAAIGAKIERVGRQKFLNQDGDLTGLVDNRILVQAEGSDVETMIMLLELIDYKALEDFGD